MVIRKKEDYQSPFLERSEAWIEEMIRKETDNLKEDTAIVTSGSDRRNCSKVEKMAEKLGYDAEYKMEDTDDKGYPIVYTLRKKE